MSLQPPTGIYDYYNDDAYHRSELFDKFKKTSELHNFIRYFPPTLEFTELYRIKGDEEILKQMYHIGGEKISLRPEVTPSLVRFLLNTHTELHKPKKMYSIERCWRNEFVTTGRRREFWQWNCDIIGVKEITAECELISTIVHLLKSYGLTNRDVMVNIGSRKVIFAILQNLNINANLFNKTLKVIDKIYKLNPKDTISELFEIGLSPDQAKSILQLKDIKNLKTLKSSFSLSDDVLSEIANLSHLSESYGFQNWIQLDLSIVRGLNYYTNIVFEVYDIDKEYRAICGGGRYNKLFNIYDNALNRKPKLKNRMIPCVGFGMGDTVIMKILKDRDFASKRPVIETKLDFYIIPFNNNFYAAACQLATILRNKGKSVDIKMITKKNVSWGYSFADELKADIAILIAPDEWNYGKVVIKKMRNNSNTKDKKGETVDLEHFLKSLSTT